MLETQVVLIVDGHSRWLFSGKIHWEVSVSVYIYIYLFQGYKCYASYTACIHSWLVVGMRLLADSGGLGSWIHREPDSSCHKKQDTSQPGAWVTWGTNMHQLTFCSLKVGSRLCDIYQPISTLKNECTSHSHITLLFTKPHLVQIGGVSLLTPAFHFGLDVIRAGRTRVRVGKAGMGRCFGFALTLCG